jgi:SAM-dependent methyltransferase
MTELSGFNYPNYWDILACPRCKRALTVDNASPLFCDNCKTQFPLGPLNQPDFRLSSILPASLQINYDPNLIHIPEELWHLPEFVTNKLVDARNLNGRPQSDIKAWILAAIKPGMTVLDLGAKSNRDQELIESLGGRYIAIEIEAEDAMILGDAHAIPMLDKTVDIVLCMSVFEHLKNPYLAAQEIRRILKPGGYLIGIVGFLESMHGFPHGSYFHHTYFGIFTLLTASNLIVKYLAIPHGWTAIHAISRAMFPGIPKRLSYMIISPLIAIQNILWNLYGLKSGDAKGARMIRDRILTSSVHFVATLPV